MLTVRYELLGIQPGERVLDLGCGFGRHAFESMRRGAHVVACDFSLAELKDVRGMFAAIREDEAATLPEGAGGSATNGDATRLPFADASFDRIIASEVLEHIPDDTAAFGELARVLKPGGTLAVTVPAWLAE
ncbi:MAG TPA: class I SAM-dependent methyltransferase, partial [Acidimicrobiales bacterium]